MVCGGILKDSSRTLEECPSTWQTSPRLGSPPGCDFCVLLTEGARRARTPRLVKCFTQRRKGRKEYFQEIARKLLRRRSPPVYRGRGPRSGEGVLNTRRMAYSSLLSPHFFRTPSPPRRSPPPINRGRAPSGLFYTPQGLLTTTYYLLLTTYYLLLTTDY